MERAALPGHDHALREGGVQVEAPDQTGVARGGARRRVLHDLAQDAAGDVARNLGVQGRPARQGHAHQQRERMDPHAHRRRLLPPPETSEHAAGGPEQANPNDLVVRVVQQEAPGELGRPLGVGGPVRDAGQVPLEAQLAQMALRVEDVRAEHLPAVREPLDHQVEDGVGVHVLLGPHVARLEERAPPEVLDPLADRVVHIVLRLRGKSD